jgi:septal ring factor EnvC (AmiA/AmiB activator)
MQHVTNEALNLSREQLASKEQQLIHSHHEAITLNEQIVALNERLGRLSGELNESQSTAARRSDQINQLRAEIETIKNTRSWRWTAWLRSIAGGADGTHE